MLQQLCCYVTREVGFFSWFDLLAFFLCFIVGYLHALMPPFQSLVSSSHCEYGFSRLTVARYYFMLGWFTLSTLFPYLPSRNTILYLPLSSILLWHYPFGADEDPHLL